jgi:hypothetical protein
MNTCQINNIVSDSEVALLPRSFEENKTTIDDTEKPKSSSKIGNISPEMIRARNIKTSTNVFP